MLVEERRNQLLELVRVRRFASLPELAEELDVSESTVRRDLEQLELQGEAKRFHGGVLYSGTSPKFSHFDARQLSFWEQKMAIAKEAVKFVEDGDVVLLDGGSTTFEVARLLVGRAIHVVTNSLPVANLFASEANSELLQIGGNICRRTGMAQGPLAVRMISELRVRKTILSVAGVKDEGFFNDNVLLAESERAMMSAADEVIVVVDSSKFGHQSLTHLCSLSDVEHLIVDNGISEDWRSKVLAAGVNLTVCGPTDNG